MGPKKVGDRKKIYIGIVKDSNNAYIKVAFIPYLSLNFKRITEVTSDPKVPGANLILPTPNIVTKRELKVLIIFNY